MIRGLHAARLSWLLLTVIHGGLLFVSLSRLVHAPVIAPRMSAALAIILILLSGFSRNQLYKRFWQQDRTTAPGYFGGCACVWGAAMAVQILLLFSEASLGVRLAGGLIAAGWHLVNVPHGRPLEPHPPTAAKAPPEMSS